MDRRACEALHEFCACKIQHDNYGKREGYRPGDHDEAERRAEETIR